jgi:hypothetical protein
LHRAAALKAVAASMTILLSSPADFARPRKFSVFFFDLAHTSLEAVSESEQCFGQRITYISADHHHFIVWLPFLTPKAMPLIQHISELLQRFHNLRLIHRVHRLLVARVEISVHVETPSSMPRVPTLIYV